MAGVRYIGRSADTDTALTSKTYIDDRVAGQGVTLSRVNSEMDSRLSNKVTKTYVDNADATFVTKTYVDNADATYIDAAKLGAASGVAKLDSSKIIPQAQLVNAPGIMMLRYVNIFPDSGLRSTTNTDFGSIAIPDPGYAYIPMVFVTGLRVTNPSTSAGATCFFECAVGGYFGTIIARGTGAGRDQAQTPLAVTVQGSLPTLTGAQNFFFRHYRGAQTDSGAGYYFFGGTQSRVCVILMPAN